jgi:hypothetical protein
MMTIRSSCIYSSGGHYAWRAHQNVTGGAAVCHTDAWDGVVADASCDMCDFVYEAIAGWHLKQVFFASSITMP